MIYGKITLLTDLTPNHGLWRLSSFQFHSIEKDKLSLSSIFQCYHTRTIDLLGLLKVTESQKFSLYAR